MITISFTDSGIIRELSEIGARVRRPAALLKVLGRKANSELKSHFRRRNRVPNRLGGRRTNYWRRVADSVNSPVVEGATRVRVAITEPTFAHKVRGGLITPKRARFLTVPVDKEAHGRTVAVFQRETGIRLFRLRRRGGGLSNLLAGVVSEGRVKVFYVLLSSVNQEPDREALPPRSYMESVIVITARSYLDRELLNRLA